jgi:hypothetical protein
MHLFINNYSNESYFSVHVLLCITFFYSISVISFEKVVYMYEDIQQMTLNYRGFVLGNSSLKYATLLSRPNLFFYAMSTT